MAKLYFSAFGDTPSVFSNIADLVAINHVPILPSYATGLEKEARVNSVQFGNGYAQEEPDGINAVKAKVNVVFQHRRKRVLEELDAFFSGEKTVIGNYLYDRTPSDYFFWLPPAPFDRKLMRVKCRNWQIVWTSADIGTLTTVFEQTFEI